MKWSSACFSQMIFFIEGKQELREISQNHITEIFGEEEYPLKHSPSFYSNAKEEIAELLRSSHRVDVLQFLEDAIMSQNRKLHRLHKTS